MDDIRNSSYFGGGSGDADVVNYFASWDKKNRVSPSLQAVRDDIFAFEEEQKRKKREAEQQKLEQERQKQDQERQKAQKPNTPQFDFGKIISDVVGNATGYNKYKQATDQIEQAKNKLKLEKGIDVDQKIRDNKTLNEINKSADFGKQFMRLPGNAAANLTDAAAVGTGYANTQQPTKTVLGNIFDWTLGIVPTGGNMIEGWLTDTFGDKEKAKRSKAKAEAASVNMAGQLFADASQQRQAMDNTPGLKLADPNSVYSKLGQAGASVLESTVLGAINPALAGATMGAESYGNVGREAYNATGNFKSSGQAAGLYAPVEGFLEQWGVQNFLQKPAKTFIGNTIKSFLREGSQEASQQLAENLIAQKFYDPKRDTWQGVAESGLYGGIVGGAAGTIQGIGLKQEQRAQIEEEARKAGYDAQQAKIIADRINDQVAKIEEHLLLQAPQQNTLLPAPEQGSLLGAGTAIPGTVAQGQTPGGGTVVVPNSPGYDATVKRITEIDQKLASFKQGGDTKLSTNTMTKLQQERSQLAATLPDPNQLVQVSEPKISPVQKLDKNLQPIQEASQDVTPTTPSYEKPPRLRRDVTPIEYDNSQLAPEKIKEATTIANDYAGQLSDMQKQTGGVQVVGNTRQSSNPDWYQKFYKENKRIPTKADIVDIAHERLLSGEAFDEMSPESIQRYQELYQEHADLKSTPSDEIEQLFSRNTSLKTVMVDKETGMTFLNKHWVKRFDQNLKLVEKNGSGFAGTFGIDPSDRSKTLITLVKHAEGRLDMVAAMHELGHGIRALAMTDRQRAEGDKLIGERFKNDDLAKKMTPAYTYYESSDSQKTAIREGLTRLSALYKDVSPPVNDIPSKSLQTLYFMYEKASPGVRETIETTGGKELTQLLRESKRQITTGDFSSSIAEELFVQAGAEYHAGKYQKGIRGTFVKLRIWFDNLINSLKKSMGLEYDKLKEMWANVYSNKMGVQTQGNKYTQADNPIKLSISTEETPTKKPKPLNTKNFNLDEQSKQELDRTVEQLRPELESIAGQPLTHEEIVNAAGQSEMLRGVDREHTKRTAAAITALRQQVAAGAEGQGVSEDFIKNLQTLKGYSQEAGRILNAFKIKADAKLTTESMKEKLISDLLDKGHSMDEIIKKSEGVDFSQYHDAVKFYRSLEKANFRELLDAYRYTNMLSSPLTHIRNAFSNILQIAVRPVTKTVAAGYDAVASVLPNHTRQQYVAEVPSYVRGVFSSIPNAFKSMGDVMKGNQAITNLDMRHIPTGKAALEAIPRLLEASDIFFRTLAESGETRAIQTKYKKKGVEASQALIEKQARESANYSIFRAPLDSQNKTGQGSLLSGVDKVTEGVMKARNNRVVGWMVPFVQTPMNIFKQGIEYSPAGVLTLKGSKNKPEQLAKATIGSAVYMGAALIAFMGDATWKEPTDDEEKKAWKASGRLPYSLKIGDKWYSFSNLGPLGYPIAFAAATKYYYTEDKDAKKNSQWDKLTGVLSGGVEYAANQSYVRGISDLIRAIQGDKAAQSNAVSNIPSQFIPLSSLQGWVARQLDPVMRKPESPVDSLKLRTPGLSKQVAPYTDPRGDEIKRTNPTGNAISPISFSQNNADFDQLHQVNMAINQAQKKATNDQISQAIGDGDVAKAKQIADAYNRGLQDAAKKIESKTAPLNDLSKDAIDEATINLSDRSIKSRQTSQETKQLLAQGQTKSQIKSLRKGRRAKAPRLRRARVTKPRKLKFAKTKAIRV